MTKYIDSYLVTEPGMTPLRHHQWLSERELDEAEDRFGPSSFDVRPAVDMLGDWLTAAVAGREQPDAQARMIVLDDLIGRGDSDPEFGSPVESEFDAATMADHRRQAITRYHRWGRLRDLGAPAIVLRNDGRMLQATARALLAATAEKSGPRMASGDARSVFIPANGTETIAEGCREERLACRQPRRSADPVQFRAHPGPAWPDEQRA